MKNSLEGLGGKVFRSDLSYRDIQRSSSQEFAPVFSSGLARLTEVIPTLLNYLTKTKFPQDISRWIYFLTSFTLARHSCSGVSLASLIVTTLIPQFFSLQPFQMISVILCVNDPT